MSHEELQQLPTLNDCVHCGLCLPACPTYFVTGREAESPRGRIAALRAIGEGRSELTPGLAVGLDDCLVCRACESHCPSGISMEALMAGYREQTEGPGRARPPLPLRQRWAGRFERFALRSVVAHPRRLELAGRVARSLAPIARHLPFLPFELPPAQRLQPPPEVPAQFEPKSATASRRGTVALLRGCVGDLWFREELLATARVLAHNGYLVKIAGPTCCGALHRHAGLRELAATQAQRAADALLALEPDHVVVESAGCAPALAEPVAPADGEPPPACATIATKVIDPLGLLARDGWRRPSKKLPGKWRVAPPCHHRHGPLPDDGTRSVLRETLEDGYMELPGPELCCGAAGFYMIRRPKLSQQIGDAAGQRFSESGATGLLTGNPGCLLRWETLLAGAGREVLHPVRALDRAYRLGGDYEPEST